jgi:hypothetical protein
VDGRRSNVRKKWVSELIDPVSRTWDVQAVRAICYPWDAEAILTIKLPARACEDFVAWSCEANGSFLVRSAYRLGIQSSLSNLSISAGHTIIPLKFEPRTMYLGTSGRTGNLEPSLEGGSTPKAPHLCLEGGYCYLGCPIRPASTDVVCSSGLCCLWL